MPRLRQAAPGIRAGEAKRDPSLLTLLCVIASTLRTFITVLCELAKISISSRLRTTQQSSHRMLSRTQNSAIYFSLFSIHCVARLGHEHSQSMLGTCYHLTFITTTTTTTASKRTTLLPAEPSRAEPSRARRAFCTQIVLVHYYSPRSPSIFLALPCSNGIESSRAEPMDSRKLNSAGTVLESEIMSFNCYGICLLCFLFAPSLRALLLRLVHFDE